MQNLLDVSALLAEGKTDQEQFSDLLKQPGVRLERIVSFGQVTPEGEWYDQNWDEWVLVLSGSARLKLASQQSEVSLSAGEHLFLPAGLKHRVTWTDPDNPTVWLALHLNEPVEDASSSDVSNSKNN